MDAEDERDGASHLKEESTTMVPSVRLVTALVGRGKAEGAAETETTWHLEAENTRGRGAW